MGLTRHAYDSVVLQPVLIEKLKRPQGRGLWAAYETARDTWGRWLFTPRRSLYQGGTGADVACCNVGSPTGPGVPVIHLVAPGAWWVATFWEPGEAEWSVTFDVCTRPAFAHGCWSYIDLELDVSVVASSGEVRIDDEDEFEAARLAGWITEEEARSVRSAVLDIRTLVEPESGFIEAGRVRLAEGHARRLDPVRHLVQEPAADRPQWLRR